MWNIGLQWNSSCEATAFVSEKWPFKKGGFSSGVEINTFMFRFTLLSGLSRGGGLSSGWPLKRGSTVLLSSHFNLLQHEEFITLKNIKYFFIIINVQITTG